MDGKVSREAMMVAEGVRFPLIALNTKHNEQSNQNYHGSHIVDCLSYFLLCRSGNLQRPWALHE